jgi:hypothetical protein
MANKEIWIVLKVVDQATAGIKKVSWELSWFAERNRDTFQKMAVAGTALFTGIVAGTNKAIQAGQKQQKAMALVERGMERVADTWTATTDDMIKEAGRLQKTSIFWDEDILQKVTNNLLTFGNVGEQTFFKAQQAAINLATTLEWDLQGSTIMLGKALENPTQWISALTRVGIAFTEQQKKQIEVLQSSGDLMWAQAIILEEVERMYWGAWQAAADALWPIHQIQKELWDVVEELGIAFAPAIQQVAGAIRPLVASLTEWIMKNPELTKNIILWAGAITWLIAVLGTLWLVLPSIVAWIWAVSTTLWVVKLAFIAVWWPITILIALMAVLVVVIYKNREKIKIAFQMWVEYIKNARASLLAAVPQRWVNLINMLVGGIMSRINMVKNAAKEVAWAIKSFLWFSSPTEEWPASNSDEWMPNLINMLSKWLQEWVQVLWEKAKAIAQSISDNIARPLTEWELKNIFENIKSEAKSVFDSLWNSIEWQKSKIESLKNELNWLSEKLKSIAQEIEGVQLAWQNDIASRAVKIQQEINKLWQSEDGSERRKALMEELELAKSLVSDEQIAQAEAMLSRTETQVILDRMIQRTAELEQKRQQTQEEYNIKQKQIQEEEKLYKQLNDQKKALDEAYFAFFNNRIQEQQRSIRQTIGMIQELNAMSWWWFNKSVEKIEGARQFGWTVQAGKSYLVWERWPEIITPVSTSKVQTDMWGGISISINMGWVTVNNDADENRLVQKITDTLTRQTQLYQFGIN